MSCCLLFLQSLRSDTSSYMAHAIFWYIFSNVKWCFQNFTERGSSWHPFVENHLKQQWVLWLKSFYLAAFSFLTWNEQRHLWSYCSCILHPWQVPAWTEWICYTGKDNKKSWCHALLFRTSWYSEKLVNMLLICINIWFLLYFPLKVLILLN